MKRAGRYALSASMDINPNSTYHWQWKKNVQDISGEVLCGRSISSLQEPVESDMDDEFLNLPYRGQQRKAISLTFMAQQGVKRPVSSMIASMRRYKSYTIVVR